MRSRLVVWSCALAIAALCASYFIGSNDGMWIGHLFSEYEPPRPVHAHLVKSRLGAAESEEPGLWDPPEDNGWKRCESTPTENDPSVQAAQSTKRYLQVLCGGGLFQLHICVSNAVSVARLLNLTLVVPYFKLHSFWNDPSQFEDLYDVEHFISYLKDRVVVVKKLPSAYSWSTPEYYLDRCLQRPNCLTFLPKHATPDWHRNNILPVVHRFPIVAVDGFEHKLTFEGLPFDVIRLRCDTNLHALRFLKPIEDLADKLSQRLTSKAPSSPGHYLGIHMRFEKDMLAHSNCDYGGGIAQSKALASFRYHMWSNRAPKGQRKPEELRKNGSCPLTPEELGLLLSAFGFRSNTPLYIAGKEPYGGNARMEPLKAPFPGIESKFTLTTKQELEPFRRYSHRLTALDFLVLFRSDVFVSNAAGNFPNVLTGHRSYFGPRKSIHPDKAFLAAAFQDASIDWTKFSTQVRDAHRMRLGGLQPRKRKYSVFRYPAPDCMCFTSRNHGADELELPE